MFFSIVIPTYNRSNELSNAINSILAQTFEYWEIIIIDDGSTDDTLRVVGDYCSRDSRIKYYNQINQGVSAARNAGAKLAQGKYILFLDSDDTVTPNWLQDFVDLLHYEHDIMYCSLLAINTESGTEVIERPSVVFHGVVSNMLAGAFAIQKNFFNKVGGYDVSMKFGENTELAMRVAEYRPSVGVVENANIIYRQAPMDRTSNQSQNIILSNEHILSKMRNGLLKVDKHYQGLLHTIAGFHYQKLGNIKMARHHFWMSFKLTPYIKKNRMRLVSSYLPKHARQILRRFYNHL